MQFQGRAFERNIGERFEDFSGVRGTYAPLSGFVVEGHVANVDPKLARSMPIDSGALGTVIHPEGNFPVGLLKGESIGNIETLGFLGEDMRYHLKAHLSRFPQLMIAFEGRIQALRRLRSNARVMRFDLCTKRDGIYYPPFRAAEFLSWVMEVYKPRKPTHLLAEWEPTSDNHHDFYRALEDNGGNTLKAARSTWSHRQFSRLGYKLMAPVSVVPVDAATLIYSRVTPSPHGDPFAIVNALYERS